MELWRGESSHHGQHQSDGPCMLWGPSQIDADSDSLGPPVGSLSGLHVVVKYVDRRAEVVAVLWNCQ
jgi:hypothetical protein